MLGGRPHDFHIIGTTDRDIDISDTVLGGKYGGRDNHLFADTDHTGQRSEQHHRLAHENALVGISVGFTVAGYDHDLHPTVIVRHPVGMTLLLPFLQQERAVEHDNRLEAVHNGFRSLVKGIVATDAEQLFDTSAVSADYEVIHIPGAYAQGFAGIERLPGFRGAETGKVEQAFVHNG